MMLMSLTACGGGDKPANSEPTTIPSGTSDNTTVKGSEPQGASAEIKSVVDGVLTIDIGNAAIVINETAVPMPYRLGELEAAGVPGDESRKEIELAPGDFFTANLFLDENEDYLISPAYYNGENDTIKIADAKAE